MSDAAAVTTYRFRVLAAEVVDGDTYRLTLDAGLRITTKQPCRLDGWDCPEKRNLHGREVSAFEKTRAATAHTVASAWFSREGTEIWATTKKDPDVYGRWLATVETADGQSLGAYLGALELASPWPQRWHERYEPSGGEQHG